MKLIVGLGNPEAKYEGTRHNTGFAALDALAEKLGVQVSVRQKRALTATAIYMGEKLILAKPQTYMNLSGESVRPLADYYNISPEDILILVDDVALKPGMIRVRPGGSDGGHNGLKSIIEHLKTDAFPRLRIGVGEAQGDMVGHVLGHFDLNTQTIINGAVKEAAEAALCFCHEGINAAMNKYNRKNPTDGV